MLDSKSNYQLIIPKGFANGFLTLSQTGEVIYFMDYPRIQKSEILIKWNDSLIKIKWPISKSTKPKIYQKDASAFGFEKYFKK